MFTFFRKDSVRPYFYRTQKGMTAVPPLTEGAESRIHISYFPAPTSRRLYKDETRGGVWIQLLKICSTVEGKRKMLSASALPSPPSVSCGN